jgi:hypothetical protein
VLLPLLRRRSIIVVALSREESHDGSPLFELAVDGFNTRLFRLFVATSGDRGDIS